MIDGTDWPDLCDGSDLDDGHDESSIAQAAGLIRDACGWHIAPSITEDRALAAAGGRLLSLPSLHVIEVTSVRLASTNEVIPDAVLSEAGLLQLPLGRRWPSGIAAVRVTMVHGLPEAPPAILSVINDLAGALSPDQRAVSRFRDVELDGAKLGNWREQGASADVMKTYGHVLRRYSL